MAACKCKFCQEKLTTAIAYMAYVGKNKFYFCNEKHHEQYLKQDKEKKEKKDKEKLLRIKFHDLFCEILQVNGITNTVLWKEKTELNKVFSDDIIVAYLEENKDWISGIVCRLNGGEYGKIRYVSTILKNKLGDYSPKIIAQNTVYIGISIDEHYETKFKLKPRKALLDFEEEYDE